MDVKQGSTAPFVVTCFDGETPAVPVDDTNGQITATADGDSSATVAATSSPTGVYAGTFTAGQVLGPVSLTVTDGVLTSAPFTGFNVIAAGPPITAPASLVITTP